MAGEVPSEPVADGGRCTVDLVAAVARNGVIGREGDLPWRLSTDLRRFKRLTMGHVLVVGRKTWDSIGRPLPGRHQLVLTRQAGAVPPGPGRSPVGDVAEVDAHARRVAAAEGLSCEPVYCIGGAEIYRQFLARARRLHITWVEAEVPGSEHFPELDWQYWKVVRKEAVPSGERDEYATTYCLYERRAAADHEAL